MSNKYLIIILFSICWMTWQGCSQQQRQRQQTTAEELPAVQDVPEGWKSLFDGKTLNGWEIVRLGGEGEPFVKDGKLILPITYSGYITGVSWVGDSLPVNNYAFYFEARRTEGIDFFATLSFPYNDTFASLILGGWSGIIVGISSIDGWDASENETTRRLFLEDKQWYQIELRVTPDSIRAFIDTQPVIELSTVGKKIHLRPGTYATSFTFMSYQTTGEIRNIRIKNLP